MRFLVVIVIAAAMGYPYYHAIILWVVTCALSMGDGRPAAWARRRTRRLTLKTIRHRTQYYYYYYHIINNN